MPNTQRRRAPARPMEAPPEDRWIWKFIAGELFFKPLARFFWIHWRHWWELLT